MVMPQPLEVGGHPRGSVEALGRGQGCKPVEEIAVDVVGRGHETGVHGRDALG